MTHSIWKDTFYSIFPDETRYLSYAPGTTNVILSAPHGGGIRPRNIPYRKYGNRGKDSYTRRLIQALVTAMDNTPYYIYSNIHRSRVDFNRDIGEAAQGNLKAEELWNTWNKTLNKYTDRVRHLHTKGLYIDLHSHDKNNSFEIGYGLNAKDYLACKNGRPIKGISTLHTLALGEETEQNMLFGRRSFVGSLEKSGFEVAMPRNDKTFLNGGRNIKTFSGNGIGAIQIECPISVLRECTDEVAMAIANSIYLFQERFLDATKL